MGLPGSFSREGRARREAEGPASKPGRLDELAIIRREGPMLHFPFTAIVGQDRMKTALVLNIINPLLRGVLICGQKGTAKSTAVRSLACLVPQMEVVTGCRFHCSPHDTEALCDECRQRLKRGEDLPAVSIDMPVVDLPLGATEDRVIGTLDLEKAIKTGEKQFQPGVLADANRGILYVDEVNLLDDHLVDILLDVAVSGVNIVEREGVSFSHPAQFILVGTMNPEEGELRPQLLDRFGLCVQVHGLDSVKKRAAVIERQLAYEEDPKAFIESWKQKEVEARKAIRQARTALREVTCSPAIHRLAARLALDFEVQGHRTDLLLVKTARTIATYTGHVHVTPEHVKDAASMVLPHRIRGKFLAGHEQEESYLKEFTSRWREANVSSDVVDEECSKTPGHMHEREPRNGSERVFATGRPYTVRHLSIATKTSEDPRSGRRSKIEARAGTGKHIGSRLPRKLPVDIAFDATVRAAAPYQIYRSQGNLALAIEYPDLREKRKRRRVAHTILFVIDASGSMGAHQRMVQAKAAVLSLLNDAYRKRDRVGLVTFNRREARLILDPTADMEKAKKTLNGLSIGGKTPLSKGLSVAHDSLKKYALRRKNEVLLLVVVSDGKANTTMKSSRTIQEARDELAITYGPAEKFLRPSLYDLVHSRALKEAIEVAEEIRSSSVRSVVIDTAISSRRGEMKELCAALGGHYFRMEELRAERLVEIVSTFLNRHNSLVLL